MIKFNLEAKKELQKGINTLTEAVKFTLGPSGRNVLISNNGSPYITKDGVTVAKNVELEDPIQQLGATIIRNVANKTCDQSGDGTTTSCVLAQAIINSGLEAITEGYNPVIVKRGMDKALASIKASIKKQSRKIVNDKQLKDVATISANGDKIIGKIISDAMKAVDRKGIITVNPSDSTETYVEEVEGVQFQQGYASPYFINNRAKMNIELNNPKIIIMKEKLKSIKDIMEILNEVAQSKDELLIITQEIESEVLNQLILNHTNGAIKVAVVKAPGFGNYQKDYIKDISIITSNQERSFYYLGYCEKAVITKDSTTIINGCGKREDIETHAKLLVSQYNASEFESDKIKIRERLAKLQGGAAIIHVGALSEVEMLEKKDRIDDALSATRAAIEEGVVIGGGNCFINCIGELKKIKAENKDEELGIKIIIEAIKAPFKSICSNAGIDPNDYITDNELKNKIGLNIRTGKLEDLFKSGIIDPAKVSRTAIENSISIAGMFLTTECVIVNKPKE